MSLRIFDAAVIGGGAAGMMAAITAARRGRSVALIEHNPFCGKKLRITGKGRCNVCNNCDIKTFLKNVPTNGKFLYSALNRFSPDDTMAYFESLGVPLKTERGSRVFPVSDNAHDIARALEAEMRRAGVFLLHDSAGEILLENGAVRGVRCAENTLQCESALIATGGASYPLTGSTGDGYRMAKALGHTVTPLLPSLVPLESDDADCAEMQGFSLKNVTLTLRDGQGKALYCELGEMMFTHFGITGPLVLSASAVMGDRIGRGALVSVIDLKPALTEEQLDGRIIRIVNENPNKALKNILHELYPQKMHAVILSLAGIAPDTKLHDLTKPMRAELVRVTKHFPLTLAALRGYNEAVVTKGGVSVKEIDPRSMQSRKVKGLCFIGEVLDLDAFTGGYNLQIAWCTAAACAEHFS